MSPPCFSLYRCWLNMTWPLNLSLPDHLQWPSLYLRCVSTYMLCLGCCDTIKHSYRSNLMKLQLLFLFFPPIGYFCLICSWDFSHHNIIFGINQTWISWHDSYSKKHLIPQMNKEIKALNCESVAKIASFSSFWSQLRLCFWKSTRRNCYLKGLMRCEICGHLTVLFP